MSVEFDKYLELFDVLLKTEEEYIKLIREICPVSWDSKNYKTPDKVLNANTIKELNKLRQKRDEAQRNVDQYLKTINPQ